MIKVVIISTVGASLLNNYARSIGEKMENLLKKDLIALRKDLISFIGEKGRAASAEINSLERILQKLSDEGINAGDIYLVFLASDTLEGRICAEAVTEFYRSKNFLTETIVVEGLKYDALEFLEKGLLSLVNTLSEQVFHHKREGRRVIINATGGFKAEAAYATLVGILNRCEVYYIHEKFQELIELPPLPITIDEDFWEKHRDILDYVKEERNLDDVKEKFGDKWKEIMLLTMTWEENGKKKIKLGPAGIAFYLVSTHEF